jgi:hypothetical protein
MVQDDLEARVLDAADTTSARRRAAEASRPVVDTPDDPDGPAFAIDDRPIRRVDLSSASERRNLFHGRHPRICTSEHSHAICE